MANTTPPRQRPALLVEPQHLPALLLDVGPASANPQDRAHPREAVKHDTEERLVPEPGQRARVDAVEGASSLGRREDRRRALGHDVTTCVGPRAAAAGFTGRTWPTTSQSQSMRAFMLSGSEAAAALLVGSAVRPKPITDSGRNRSPSVRAEGRGTTPPAWDRRECGAIQPRGPAGDGSPIERPGGSGTGEFLFNPHMRLTHGFPVTARSAKLNTARPPDNYRPHREPPGGLPGRLPGRSGRPGFGRVRRTGAAVPGLQSAPTTESSLWIYVRRFFRGSVSVSPGGQF